MSTPAPPHRPRPVFGFERLEAFQYAVRYCVQMQPIIERIPKGYAPLGDQLRRAMTSVVLNIAEGSGRGSGDARRFYQIARGSALECASVLLVLRAIKAVEEANLDEPLTTLHSIASMTVGPERGTRRDNKD